MKRCPACEIELPVDRFSTGSSICKPCKASLTREWRINNPEKAKELDTRKHLRRKYGLTLEQRKEMYDDQEGNCASCGRYGGDTNGPSGDGLVIDHSHHTGQVRALLCHNCNVGIGHFEEDVQTMKRAVDYLRERGFYG